MTLLDAAKALVGMGLIYIADNGGYYICPGCNGYGEDHASFAHEPDCPWLAMPQIIAALAAAQKLVDEARELNLYHDDDVLSMQIIIDALAAALAKDTP